MSRNKKGPDGAAIRPGCEPQGGHHENKSIVSQNQDPVKSGRRRKRMEQNEELRKPGYWAVLPAQVRYDPELPASAKLLYAEISSLTDMAGYCFASNAYFMKLYGMSERTVQNLLKALKDRGYIQILDGSGGAGKRRIYAGINPVEQNHANFCGVTPQIFAPNPANFCTHIKKDNKKEINPPKAPQGAAGGIWDPEAFARFWALYPKKKDKAKAIKEWNKLRADRNLMKTMTAALRRQIASEEWTRENGRAIPYPCRWLSHRRWEDEDVTPAAGRQAAPEEDLEWV